MFKEPYDIIHPENHVDPRGSLFELLRFKDYKIFGKGYIYCFSINPGQRRGDHYHKKKKEWFSCVYGKAIILLEDKKGHKKKIVLSPEKPAVIYCGPYTNHTFFNDTTDLAVLISYGSKQHEPNDPDTFFKKIK